MRFAAPCAMLWAAVVIRVVPVESAIERLLGGDSERLRVGLVHDQVCLVIAHVRAIMKILGRQGMRHDSEQSFREFLVIVREPLRHLPGGRVQRYAIARRQSSKESRRRIADESGILHREVHVVEDHGDNRCAGTTALPPATSALEEEPSAGRGGHRRGRARLWCLHIERRDVCSLRLS